MNALILAAGFGTRLGDASEGLPKPLIDIGGIPLLKINIEKLVKAGFDQIYINGHYKYESIKNFLELNYNNSTKTIFIYEPEILGTAGTVKKLVTDKNLDTLLVMHGDNFFKDDLRNLLEAFRNLPTYYWGVVGYFQTDKPENFGILELDSENIVIGFHEKKYVERGNFANSAIYLFNKNGLKIFTDLNSKQPDISLNVMPELIGRIKAVKLNGEFIDIGTPENLKKARKLN
jgi:mannose-1-phosphate guanylyltransferase